MTADHDDHEHHPHDDTAERTTAPQSDYTGREVAIGAAVALVGLLVVFAVPLLLA
ncbi:hypothetical protein [Halosegnis sp.]|uniref:DUF7550 family protein n=1 Tax=Halosegnis sp. TaxID=2864959 RepID=UPI0035D4F3F3